MADVFYGLNHGADKNTVTSGVATTAKTIELRVTSGTASPGIPRKEIFRALKAFERYLLSNEGMVAQDNI